MTNDDRHRASASEVAKVKNGRPDASVHVFVRWYPASIELGIEPELAVWVVSNTITDLDHCTSTEDAPQHMCTPSDLVSVVAMMDRLVSNELLCQ